MIFTVYNERINKNVVDLQKKVCQKYEVDINQIFVKNWVSHGHSVDQILKDFKNSNDVIVLFDIDSIPLNFDIVPKAINWAKENIGIFSVAQKQIKSKNPIIHAGPAFMVFSIETFNILNRPTFEATNRSDCGGEMTHSAREKGVEVRLMYPTEVDRKDFYLDGYIMFGLGTNYENNIYHAFESRLGHGDNFFINKCKQILN